MCTMPYSDGTYAEMVVLVLNRGHFSFSYHSSNGVGPLGTVLCFQILILIGNSGLSTSA